MYNLPHINFMHKYLYAEFWNYLSKNYMAKNYMAKNYMAKNYNNK